jgi:hypothetical protein
LSRPKGRGIKPDFANKLVALSTLHGTDGRDGANGRDGTDGQNGADGKDGDSVDLQVTETYIQWKHTSDTNWQNLIALSLLKGANGSNDADGISIVWRGDLSSPPENPETNWAYYNSTEGKSCIWNGSSWDIMAQASFSLLLPRSCGSSFTFTILLQTVPGNKSKFAL